MVFVSFNTTGVTCGAGTADPSEHMSVHPSVLVEFLLLDV